MRFAFFIFIFAGCWLKAGTLDRYRMLSCGRSLNTSKTHATVSFFRHAWLRACHRPQSMWADVLLQFMYFCNSCTFAIHVWNFNFFYLHLWDEGRTGHRMIPIQVPTSLWLLESINCSDMSKVLLAVICHCTVVDQAGTWKCMLG
jgi:hypothetical protein